MPIFDKPDKKQAENAMERELKVHLETQIAILEKLTDAVDELKSRIMNLQGRLSVLEKIMEQKLPNNLLTEDKFLKEVQGSDEIVDRILNEMKGLAGVRSAREILADKIGEREKPGIVESKRIERITVMLQQHGKLSSQQLSQLMGLSRTRCNEYFKQMENLRIVEPVIIGKEKFYRLS